MAVIEQRGKSWRALIRLKGFPSVSRTFDSRRDAKLWAQDAEARMRSRRWGDTPKPVELTVEDGITRYLKEISPNKKGYQQEIYRARVICRHPIAKFAMANVRGATVSNYRDERLKVAAPTTVNNEMTMLSHLYTVAIKEWGLALNENPVTKTRRPKLPKGRDRRILPSEEKALLDACNSDKHRTMIMLALDSGMRRGELSALQRRNVDLDSRLALLLDTKNGEHRDIPLTRRVVAGIAALPEYENGSVFNMEPISITTLFSAIRKRAGIPDVRWHDMRHEACSRLFERGFDIQEVSRITGHKTWSQLARYTHLRAADLLDRID